jgi:FkbM family methyltransferase
MFFKMSELERAWGVQPRSILHVGAHMAEEFLDYNSLNPNKIIWVEANPQLAEVLRVRFNADPVNQVVEAAAWDRDDVLLELNVTSNTQSSSLLKLKDHAVLYPDIVETHKVTVTTSRLDSVLDSDYGIKIKTVDKAIRNICIFDST